MPPTQPLSHRCASGGGGEASGAQWLCGATVAGRDLRRLRTAHRGPLHRAALAEPGGSHDVPPQSRQQLPGRGHSSTVKRGREGAL